MSLNPTRPVVRLAFILLPLLKLITTWKRIEIWSGKGRGSILIKAYMEWSVSRGDFLKPIDTAKLVAAVIIYNWRYYNIICSGTTKQGGGGGGRRGGGGERGEGRGGRGGLWKAVRTMIFGLLCCCSHIWIYAWTWTNKPLDILYRYKGLKWVWLRLACFVHPHHPLNFYFLFSIFIIWPSSPTNRVSSV